MISIVDDDHFVREGMEDLVQSLGYEAATFESAEHFLRSGRLAETACLITDLRMPDMDGLGLLETLRTRPDVPMPRVVVVVVGGPAPNTACQSLANC